jgi:hypothetical protein
LAVAVAVAVAVPVAVAMTMAVQAVENFLLPLRHSRTKPVR